MAHDDDSEKEKTFRKVRLTAESWTALSEMLDGFDRLEYDAWDDKDLGCVVCILHIPERQKGDADV
ncbi:MAG TPA: hypothetical protein VJH94_02260 [Candidatus Paceibacterota bacterium]